MNQKPIVFNSTQYTEEVYNTLSHCVFSHSKDNDFFLSIVVPTYDRQDLLLESLNSILNQKPVSYAYEVIVICDNPKNANFEYQIKELAIKNISVYMNKQNLGLFETLNCGVRLAKGKYVAFLHDDDLLKENYLTEIEKLLKLKKSIGAIMVSTQQIGNVSYRSRFRETSLYKFLKPIKDSLSHGKMYRLRIFDNILWCADQYGAPSCGSVWDKEKFISLGGYSTASYPSGDWFYMVEFNKHYRVYKTSEQLGYYRWSNNASTKAEIIRKFITDNLALREYFREHYFLGKIVYALTKKEHYRHIIDVFLTFDKTGKLKPHDFDEIMPYPKNSLRYKVYLNSQRLYWVLRVMISLVFG